MKSNNWNMQKAVVLWSLLVLFSLGLQGEEPEQATCVLFRGTGKHILLSRILDAEVKFIADVLCSRRKN